MRGPILGTHLIPHPPRPWYPDIVVSPSLYFFLVAHEVKAPLPGQIILTDEGRPL